MLSYRQRHCNDEALYYGFCNTSMAAKLVKSLNKSHFKWLYSTIPGSYNVIAHASTQTFN